MQSKLLLYGAYGYTGQLIAQRADNLGMELCLAGRREDPLKAMAAQFGWQYQCFTLDDPVELVSRLSEFSLVIHAAGPFTYTARQMMEACISARTHYIDITGELDVFETAFELSNDAIEAGIMLMPGTGFDVVPTDCMAVYVSEQMAESEHLTLCFATIPGDLSRGTARSATNKLGMSNYARINGKLENVRYGHVKSTFVYGTKTLKAQSIPWGDLFTAYHSTRIPNISTCMVFGKRMAMVPALINSFGWLLRKSFIKKWLLKKIDAMEAGPNEDVLKNGKSVVWAEVLTKDGHSKKAAIETSNGYKLTAEASILIAGKILSGSFKPGFQTPAKCYGSQLVFELEGTKWLKK